MSGVKPVQGNVVDGVRGGNTELSEPAALSSSQPVESPTTDEVWSDLVSNSENVALHARGTEANMSLEKASGPSTGSVSSTSVVSLMLDGASAKQPVEEFRFEKNGAPGIEFPLDAEEVEMLRTTKAVSPILVSDPRVVVKPDFLPPPSHPEDPEFWPEFEEIIDLQLARREGKMADEVMDLPKIFENYTMDEGAQAVRADFPSKWPTALVEQFLMEGAKVDPSIIPQRSQDDFVRGPVLLSRIVGWAVSEVSPSAFAAKWSEGRARPEAVAWAIHTGELEAPPEIQEKIAELNLKSPMDFTAYQEGCPRHPSWPAMHSAASSASLYLAVLMDLSPEQIAEAKKLDYAVAAFRSLAGVHYDTDNRAGLALGQEVIARQLPEMLAEFGADPDAVREKIERIRHDWYDYEAQSAEGAA